MKNRAANHGAETMSQPQLIVMAAGLGRRYGGAKQVEPVGPAGEVLLDYAVYDAIRAGFGKVVFVIRRDFAEAFKASTGRWVERRVETAYAYQDLGALPGGLAPPPQRTKPWGTGQAVLAARDAVEGPFAVINADDFYGATSFGILADYLKTARDTGGVADFCMVGYVLARTLTEHGHVARGVCSVDEDGHLAAIVERLRIKRFGPSGDKPVVRYTENGDTWIDLPPQSTVSMNMWGFTPCFFDALADGFEAFLKENLHSPTAEYLIPGVVDSLIRSGKARVKVLPTDEQWYGITYRQDKPRVEQAVAEMVRRGVYPEDLRK